MYRGGEVLSVPPSSAAEASIEGKDTTLIKKKQKQNKKIKKKKYKLKISFTQRKVNLPGTDFGKC